MKMLDLGVLDPDDLTRLETLASFMEPYDAIRFLQRETHYSYQTCIAWVEALQTYHQDRPIAAGMHFKSAVWH
jgi:hypothetical protein